MGDDEFKKFLDGNENDPGIPFCQKRLVFDIIKQKMDHTKDLINIFSKIQVTEPDYKHIIEDLYGESKDAMTQLDYISALVMDEINENLGEDDDNDDDDPIMRDIKNGLD